MTSQARQVNPPSSIDLSLGVIVERRPGVTRWQRTVIVPHSVFLTKPDLSIEPRELYRQGECLRYLAGCGLLTLHRKETNDYLVNLTGQSPRVFVGLRHDRDGGEFAWKPFLVTASPFEAEAYMHGGEELVDAVAMPIELVEAIRQFIDTHHQDEPFKKRKRVKHFDKDDTPFARPPGWRETDR